MTPASAIPREHPSGLPYRPCVGVMLVNAEGLIFTGQRLDQMVEAWQMPQGGIDPGEDPYDTALRELWEETGVDPALTSLLGETPEWHYYDLPDELIGKIWKGRFAGQRQKWFALRFLGTDSDVNIATAHQEFRNWRWSPVDSLIDMAAPLQACALCRCDRGVETASVSLERFLDAQAGGVFERALSELQQGRKRSHWMWFIFPQMKGLGHSQTSQFFGLAGLAEAAAYLAHPVLGERLLAVCKTLQDWPHLGAEAVFGSIDALKLRSCLTLFSAVPAAPPIFANLPAAYFDGKPCQITQAAIK